MARELRGVFGASGTRLEASWVRSSAFWAALESFWAGPGTSKTDFGRLLCGLGRIDAVLNGFESDFQGQDGAPNRLQEEKKRWQN